MSVLLYALGGGWGHVSRAASIAFALEAAGTRSTVIVPKDRAWLCLAKGARAWPVPKTSAPDALRAHLRKAVATTRAQTLLVDTFPCGVLGELDGSLDIQRRTLLIRLYRGLERQMPAIESYEHVLDIEPNLLWRPTSVPATELGPIAGPRAPIRTPGTALLFAWDRLSWAFLRKLQLRLHRRNHRAWVVMGGQVYKSASTESASRLLFALPARGVKLIVGAAGYNLCYEAIAAKVPHLAIPRARAYDDQTNRATQVASAPGGPHALEDRALALLAGEHYRAPQVTPISARTVAQKLLQLWRIR